MKDQPLAQRPPRPTRASFLRERIRLASIAADARSNASLSATRTDSNNQRALDVNGSFGFALSMPIGVHRRRPNTLVMAHREPFRSWKVLNFTLQDKRLPSDVSGEDQVSQDLTLCDFV